MTEEVKSEPLYKQLFVTLLVNKVRNKANDSYVLPLGVYSDCCIVMICSVYVNKDEDKTELVELKRFIGPQLGRVHVLSLIS